MKECVPKIPGFPELTDARSNEWTQCPRTMQKIDNGPPRVVGEVVLREITE